MVVCFEEALLLDKGKKGKNQKIKLFTVGYSGSLCMNAPLLSLKGQAVWGELARARGLTQHR